MTDSDYPRRTTCPRCGAQVPEGPHWATWCDQCDWNVVAGHAGAARLRFLDRAKRRVVDRAAGRLSRSIESDPSRLEHRPSRAFELGLSLVALGGYAGVGVVGALAALGRLPVGFWRWPLAVFCALLLWALHPRGPRLGPDEHEVSREECPALHEAVGLVATAVQAPKPERIAVTLEPRVDARPLGLAGRPALVIGLPLWAASGWAARTALLAHEIAHQDDRQSAVGQVVATARHLAWEAVHVMWPVPGDVVSLRPSNRPLGGLARAVQRGFALPLVGFALLLDLAGAPVRMVAEYRADAAAARVAGTGAAVAALASLTAVDPLLVPARSAVRRDEDPWAALEALPPPPGREVERLTRASRALGHHTDSEHPPTWMRIRVLGAVRGAALGMAQEEARVTIPPDLRERVNAAMAALQRRFDADFRARLTA
ncbi:MAG TPA: M48 family metallopeptidase [Dermatophilaceae bacterium]|nr:M48 family metallopeptidase [Dermatophilaceae bacterium]